MTQQKNQTDWNKIADDIMTVLVADRVPFNGDDFARLAKAAGMPNDELKRISGGIFRKFKASGKIKKLPAYALSSRNSSNVLPMWICA